MRGLVARGAVERHVERDQPGPLGSLADGAGGAGSAGIRPGAAGSGSGSARAPPAAGSGTGAGSAGGSDEIAPIPSFTARSSSRSAFSAESSSRTLSARRLEGLLDVVGAARQPFGHRLRAGQLALDLLGGLGAQLRGALLGGLQHGAHPVAAAAAADLPLRGSRLDAECAAHERVDPAEVRVGARREVRRRLPLSGAGRGRHRAAERAGLELRRRRRRSDRRSRSCGCRAPCTR